MIIEGGPGTGKTIIASHRAAYFCQHRRRRLDFEGDVPVVGPTGQIHPLHRRRYRRTHWQITTYHGRIHYPS